LAKEAPSWTGLAAKLSFGFGMRTPQDLQAELFEIGFEGPRARTQVAKFADPRRQPALPFVCIFQKPTTRTTQLDPLPPAGPAESDIQVLHANAYSRRHARRGNIALCVKPGWGSPPWSEAKVAASPALKPGSNMPNSVRLRPRYSSLVE